MRMASALRWPWLVMGSAPPVESMRISDQMMPVRICTDATCEMAMLSSVVPNSRGFTRLTCNGLTTMRVGKSRLPRVQRLALKVSPANCADSTDIQDSAVGIIQRELNHLIPGLCEHGRFFAIFA